MDLKRLDALVALAREGTVSAAADSLGCGQPTVSHHLRRLEGETGAVLVQRVGRGVRLTPDGERLARRGEEILGLVRRAAAELDTVTTLAAGHVRLAAFPSACSTLVPNLLATLGETVPGMTLDLVEAEPPEAARMLQAGDVDVAITFAFAGQAFAGDITVEHLGWDALHLVEPAAAAGGDAQAEGVTGAPALGTPGIPERVAAAGCVQPQALRRLKDARWIAGCERCRTGLVDLCASVGIAPDIGFASDDVVAVQALVAAGFGVTLLPGLALAGHRHPGVVTRHVLGAGRELQIATHGRPPRPAAVEEVVQTLLALSSQVLPPG